MLPNNDDAIIWRGPRKNGLIKQFLTDVQWGELDYLIIDTPPGTSDEHISIVQYMKDVVLDGAVVVTTPQEVAMMDVRKELNFCRKTKIPVLGVVENMSCVQRQVSKVKYKDVNGKDVTEKALRIIQEKAPEVLEYLMESTLFPTAGEGPEGMARAFNVPFLGRLPLDADLTTSCEEGKSFLEDFPNALGAPAFRAMVNSLEEQIKK